jgi:hypothetical protein
VTWRKQGQRLVPLESSEAENLAEENPFDFESNEDRRHVAEAFRSLPETWREVLWLREVLDLGTKEAASRMRITPNAAAALTFRAKEGLRQAWIGRQIKTRHLPEECKINVERLPGYVRGSLGPRDKSKTDKHLAECETCPDILTNTRQLTSRLHLILVPVALATGGALLSVAGSDPASATTSEATAGELGARGAASKFLNSKTLLLLGIGAVIASGLILPNVAPTMQRDSSESRNSGGTTATDPDSPAASDPGREFLDDPTLAGRNNDAVRSALYSLPIVAPGSAPVFSTEEGTTTSESGVLLSGFATPGARVRLTVDGAQGVASEQRIQALSNGAWYVTVEPLPVGNYTATARQQPPGGSESDAAAVSFSVASSGLPPTPQVTRIDTRETRYLPIVRGTAGPGSTIIVWINGVRNEGTADQQGAWSVYPDRGGVAGSNAVSIQAVDPTSNRASAPTKPVTFTLVSPSLELDRRGSRPTIIANAIPKSLIVVTDRDSFVYLAETPEGKNTYTVPPNSTSPKLDDASALTAVYTSEDGRRVGAPLVILK